MALWVEAGLWGLLAGGALVVGAAVAWFVPVRRTVVAAVMAFGAGVPEAIALGLSLVDGNGVGVAVLAAIVISNLPEGLSSAAGMKHNGRSATYVFGVWIGIAVACGIAGGLGCLLLDDARPETTA